MKRLLPFAILALAIGGFMLLKATRPAPPAITVQERVWHIDTQTIQPTSLRPTLTLYGRVEAPDRVRAASPVSGRVLEVLVRDGERVRAGQVLARLDPRDLEPRLAQARADVEREKVRYRSDQAALAQERRLLALAEDALRRAELIQAQKLGSQASTDQAREQLSRAQLAVTQREQALAEHPARLAQLQSKLAEAERDAARGEIIAPFAARIGKVEAAAGDQVQPNQTLLTLYPSDAIYLRAKVPAHLSEELRAALQRGEELTARADFGGKPLRARLERLSGEADARGVDALLKLDDPTGVPIGAFVNAQLERPLAPDAVALPFSALHGGDRIYLVKDGRLKGVTVQRIGELRINGEARLLVHAEALRPGDVVMITHLPHAIDGLAVTPIQRAS
ncbi:efflux RND transporter periplasmic adaptor subunit [Thiofaba sp. EF100]|jgi:RND family efflux transporter MFP subunit|uniref:efflux RND transporter periplasmic adaptor subunit n=1 Tax=Thiofaba sp. EF100 TaxID=3121274 RepID=UPI0032215DCB